MLFVLNVCHLKSIRFLFTLQTCASDQTDQYCFVPFVHLYVYGHRISNAFVNFAIVTIDIFGVNLILYHCLLFTNYNLDTKCLKLEIELRWPDPLHQRLGFLPIADNNSPCQDKNRFSKDSFINLKAICLIYENVKMENLKTICINQLQSLLVSAEIISNIQFSFLDCWENRGINDTRRKPWNIAGLTRRAGVGEEQTSRW